MAEAVKSEADFISNEMSIFFNPLRLHFFIPWNKMVMGSFQPSI